MFSYVMQFFCPPLYILGKVDEEDDYLIMRKPGGFIFIFWNFILYGNKSDNLREA